jgi:hypothetical protein
MLEQELEEMLELELEEMSELGTAMESAGVLVLM